METSRVPRVGFVGRAIKDIGKTIWTVLLRWQEREEMRSRLADMDDRILKDVGLTREDLLREIAKPFWRP
jgi:uncharacterized protein YjiS (DUF1127 family)